MKNPLAALTNKTDDTAVTLSLDEFREFMITVNRACRGIGCGYVRRDCRVDAMTKWLSAWAGSNRARLLALPRLRKEFNKQLPDYFRDFSEQDRTIENEGAFLRVHALIVKTLAA